MENLQKKVYLQVHSTFLDEENENHFYHYIRFMLSEWIQNLILLCFSASYIYQHVIRTIYVRVWPFFFSALCSFENPTDELNLVWWREQRPTSCNWIFKRATANQSFSVRRSWMFYVLRATHGWLFMPLIFQDSSQIVVILAIAVLLTPSLTISYHRHLFPHTEYMLYILAYMKCKLGMRTGMGRGRGTGTWMGLGFWLSWKHV